MFTTKSILFIFSTIVLCESWILENLTKCDINDGDCERDLIQTVLQDISKTGISELGIPPTDPIELEGMSFPILDILNLTLVSGSLKGIKNCKVDKYFTDVKKEHGFMELKCDTLATQGKYKAFASNPLIKTLLGGETIHGDGNFKLIIENLRIRIEFDFYIQQRDDDIYIKCKRDKYLNKHDIGKITFFVDGLYLGTQDASKMVSSLLNENWKLLTATFGKTFMDRAMEIIDDHVYKFFDSVPCKYYLLNDLTEYAKP